jgi:hypothetical protein
MNRTHPGPGSVTLSAARSPHRRVAGTRPRVFAPKGRRNVATGGVPACRDGTRGHFVRMHSRPGWGGGSSIAAHAIQRSSIPRPLTGPAVPWGLAPTGSARACRPSLHPWQQSSAPFGAAESVTDPRPHVHTRPQSCCGVCARQPMTIGSTPLAVAKVILRGAGFVRAATRRSGRRPCWHRPFDGRSRGC